MTEVLLYNGKLFQRLENSIILRPFVFCKSSVYILLIIVADTQYFRLSQIDISLSMCKCWFVTLQRRRIRLYWDARPSPKSTCDQKCTGWFYGGMWDCMSADETCAGFTLTDSGRGPSCGANAIMGRCGRWYNRGHHIFLCAEVSSVMEHWNKIPQNIVNKDQFTPFEIETSYNIEKYVMCFMFTISSLACFQ